MRKHDVSAERITNREPQDVAICYGDGVVIHLTTRQEDAS